MGAGEPATPCKACTCLKQSRALPCPSSFRPASRRLPPSPTAPLHPPAQADALSGLLDLGGASAGVLVAKASRLLFTTLDAVDVMGTHLPALVR